MSGTEKNFTTWKMQWVDALMIGVDSREFRVAVCLLEHVGTKTFAGGMVQSTYRVRPSA